MRLLFVLTALLGGLLSTSAQARQEPDIKIVPTVIGISVHDRNGQLLVTSDSMLVIVLDQFGKRAWPEEYWATMIVDPGVDRSLVPIRFPLNTKAVNRLSWYAKIFNSRKITVGFSVFDMRGQPLRADNGVRITLNQIGSQPWPSATRVVIEGDLDERGHITSVVNFPLDEVVINNLTALAKQSAVNINN